MYFLKDIISKTEIMARIFRALIQLRHWFR